MIFLISGGKMTLPFSENMIFFYKQKIKDNISQKLHGNMMLSVCW